MRLAVPQGGGWLVFWLLVLAGAALFLLDEIGTMLDRYAAKDFRWSIRPVFVVTHFALALPILLFAPLQFSARLRRSWPGLHHWIGTVYLAASALAALLAIYLGVTIQFTGSRVPLVIFGTLWLAFTAAAWQTARRRDFVAHQRFVVRGVALALAFVWVRVMGIWEDQLFGFMKGELRGTTREWLSFVLPLLAVETWLTWWPSARRSFRPVCDRPSRE